MSGAPDQNEIWITTLEQIAKDLESYGPASDGVVHFDLDDGSVNGNRAGFLHLAAALLLSVRGPGVVDLPMEFISDDGSIEINSVCCDNSYVPPPEESFAENAANFIAKVGCITIGLAIFLGMVDFVYRINAYLAGCAGIVVGGSILASWVSSRLRRNRMKGWSSSTRV
jgi:hypothetical protein